MEKHRKLGGNLETDVSYQYLLYFMEDEVELRKIAYSYRRGLMTSKEIKTINKTLRNM